MTSDGGFWAGEHLKKLNKYDIPLAMPPEAFSSKKLLNCRQILPLTYVDGISNELMQASGLNCKRAVRNGTVSGTALLFAIEYSDKNIYMCGLDMANQKGFQHAQPNELEKNAAIFDTRIKSKENRLARAELTKGSLDIYKDWFSTNNFEFTNRKVYRLIEKEDRKNSLGSIIDIDLALFKSLTKNNSENKQNIFYKSTNPINLKKIRNFINENINNKKWMEEIFPLDYLSLSHNNENTEIKNKIKKEWNNLLNKIFGILDENI